MSGRATAVSAAVATARLTGAADAVASVSATAFAVLQQTRSVPPTLAPAVDQAQAGAGQATAAAAAATSVAAAVVAYMPLTKQQVPTRRTCANHPGYPAGQRGNRYPQQIGELTQKMTNQEDEEQEGAYLIEIRTDSDSYGEPESNPEDQ